HLRHQQDSPNTTGCLVARALWDHAEDRQRRDEGSRKWVEEGEPYAQGHHHGLRGTTGVQPHHHVTPGSRSRPDRGRSQPRHSSRTPLESGERGASDGSDLPNRQTRPVHVYLPLANHPALSSFDVNLDALLRSKTDLKDAVVVPGKVEDELMRKMGVSDTEAVQ